MSVRPAGGMASLPSQVGLESKVRARFLPAQFLSSVLPGPRRVRPERGKAREGLWAAQSSSEAGRGKLIENRNARLSFD